LQKLLNADYLAETIFSFVIVLFIAVVQEIINSL